MVISMKPIPIDKITHTGQEQPSLRPCCRGASSSRYWLSSWSVGKELWDAQGHGAPDRIDALVSESGLDKVGQRVQTNYESKTNGV